MIIDRSSLAMSSIMGMWGPLEFLAMGAQAGIAYQKIGNGQELTINATSLRRMLDVPGILKISNGIAPLVFYGTAFAILVYIITNVLFALIFSKIISKD